MADTGYGLGTRVSVVKLGAMTGSTGTELPIFEAPMKLKVSKVSVIDTTAIAANDTNYGTGTAYNKGTTGSGTTSVGAQTTKSTGGAAVAAFKGWDLTLTAGAETLKEGEVLSFKWTEAGSGQDLVAAVVQVVWSPHAGM